MDIRTFVVSVKYDNERVKDDLFIARASNSMLAVKTLQKAVSEGRIAIKKAKTQFYAYQAFYSNRFNLVESIKRELDVRIITNNLDSLIAWEGGNLEINPNESTNSSQNTSRNQRARTQTDLFAK